MRRLVGYGVALGAVVLLMFFPALFGGGSSAGTTTDVATIKNFQATYDVASDGTLHVTETLLVNFPVYKHGIYQFFDTADSAGDSHVRMIPKDIAVTRDGAPDDLEISRQGHGRYLVARIGQACCTITGDHTYVITYTVDGALSKAVGGGSGSMFYWDVVQGGWQMSIDKAQITVNLPSAPSQVKCAIGNGATGGCKPTVSGNSVSITTGALQPNTPITVQAPLETKYPGQVTLPWTSRFDPVFGQSVPVAVVFLVLAGIALLFGAWVARSVREEAPAFPLMYAPPEGIGPAQAAYLMTEKVNNDAYAATMLQLGEKGLATLDHQGDAWTITGTQGDWAGVDEITGQTAAELGVSAGHSFTAQPGDVAGGQKMQAARKGFDGAVKSWARSAGFMELHWLPRLGALVVIGCILIAAWQFFWNPFNISLAGLPFAVFAVIAISVVDERSATFRTKTGRDLWSRIGGFRRVLGTTSSEARFDFSGRQDLYLQYVPWAVAFGVADIWAQKYRVEMQQEPPAPGYFIGGYAAGWNPTSVSTFSDSFNSSVSSAISAYQATQSSSSGGGGGFSGGGGGGGGGGGSW